MLLRTSSKWVWVSLAIALGGGVFTLACGDDLPHYIPNPNYTPAVVNPTTLPLPPAADSGGVYSNCGPYYGPHYTREDLIPNFLKWTPDGSHIVFDDGRGSAIIGGRHDPGFGSDVHLLDNGGTFLRRIVDANPGFVSAYGTYADVSPDGKRIVYASCEYGMDRGIDYTGHEWKEREQYEYEIVTRNIDGTDPRRLTENIVMDHFPVWSPDGSRIAFARSSNRNFPRQGIEDDNGIVISSLDGSDQQVIASIAAFDCSAWVFGWHSVCSDRRVRGDLRNALDTLVGPNVISWSPDGGSLAFESGGAVHTVGADGSNLTRLSVGGWMVTESPAWSPDGSLVAFGRSSEDISDIVVSTPDDSDGWVVADLKGISLWTSDGLDVRFSAIPESTDSSKEQVAADLVATSIAWSPDGSEIRFVGSSLESMGSGDWGHGYAGIFSVGADGSDMRIIAEIEWPSLVSWSPDGSRVAVRIMSTSGSSNDDRILTPKVVLYTMSSDGSDKRVLVRGTPTQLVAERSDRGDVSRDVAACSGGYVVPDPQDNPGLVRDCETLLGLREALAGDAVLNWSAEVPIEGWQGVLVKGSPLRVRWLNFHRVDTDEGLTGGLPPELGNLTALERLWFRSQYRLGGEIPPELGKLSNLKDLVLEADLGGEIPSELGNLTSLEGLNLGTGLGGEIPSELGNLHNLKGLGLSNNDLTGNIPLELGDIGKGLSISVYGNSGLTGRVPSKVWYSVNSIDIRRTSLMPPRGIVCTEEVFIGQQCRTK